MSKQKKIIITVSAAVLAVIVALVIVLVAVGGKSEPEYTIAFDSNGGTEVSAITAKSGATIAEPEAPTKEFFRFLGWFREGETTKYTFDTMPAENLLLIAGWQAEESYRISFVANGGGETEDIIAVAGEKIEKPADPVREGYVFVGWFADAAFKTPFSFTEMPSVDTTLYAKWSNAEGYCYVSLYVNGVNKGIYPVVAGEAVTFPEDIYEEGTVSEGWFLDESMKMAFDPNTAVEENYTLYSNSYTSGLQISGGTVTGIQGSPVTVVIPSIYKENKITAIGNNAFYGISSIETVVFPAGIRTIGDYAFYNCDYLVNAVYPSSLDSVGQYAFYGCQRLRYVGDLLSAEEVPTGLFNGCQELRGIRLGENIRKIGAFAFADCNLLTEIALPESLREIDNYAFANAGITQVALPGALNSLGVGVFNGCDIAEIVADVENAVFTVADGALYGENGTVLIRYFGSSEEFEIPATVFTVKKDAFVGNVSIKELTVGEGTTLEQGALRGLSALEKLSVPTLGDGFLAGLFGASKATDNGTESIYVPATLKKLTVAGGITEIPAYAFYGCCGLETVTGLENVTAIGEYAFAYTGFRAFTLPANLTELPVSAFAGCESLTAYDVAGGNTAYTEANGCLYNTDGNVLRLVPAGLKEIVFPEAEFTIAAGAFEGSTVVELTLPANSSLENGALRNMNNLYTLRTPYIGKSKDASETENFMLYAFGGSKTGSGDSVSVTGSAPNTLRKIELYGEYTAIPDYAFYGLSEVARISLPSTVTSIGSFSFAWSGLVALPLTGVKEIGGYAFFGCTDVSKIVVPATVEKLGEAAFAYCIGLTSVTFEEGVKEIPNSLCFPFVQKSEYYSNLTEINIPASVESIGDAAFAFAGVYEDSTYECEVEFAENSVLRSIGSGAFAQSTVATISLPASLESIGEEAFVYCTMLQSVKVGNAEDGSALAKIGVGAFVSCEELESFTLYKSVADAQECPVLELSEKGNAPFFGSDNCKFYVPAESVAFFCAADGWSTYASRLQAVSADK